MAPTATLLRRDTETSAGTLNTTIIIGFVVAGVILAGFFAWLALHFYRKRSQSKAASNRNSAFLNIKGVIKEGDEEKVADAPSGGLVRSKTNGFSRAQLTQSIVMPNKTIVRPDATKDEIIKFHVDNGTITRPFSFAMNGGLVPPPSPGRSGFGSRPVSTISWVGEHLAAPQRSSRNSSFFSAATRITSSIYSSNSSNAGAEKRAVRQLFNPVLPDELVINLGEKVTVMQSFDDGWCIVCRDSMLNPGQVEMGAIPAWVFVKPVQGLKTERPMRSSSLGVTVEMNGPGFSSREECVSWSNF